MQTAESGNKLAQSHTDTRAPARIFKFPILSTNTPQLLRGTTDVSTGGRRQGTKKDVAQCVKAAALRLGTPVCKSGSEGAAHLVS